jgi:3-deoxy-7-phosphoheptulonate synthase
MNEFAKRRQWGPTPKYALAEAYVHPSNDFVIISGPCSVESKEQISKVAEYVAAAGATHLRGGIFRAGTYPGQNFGWIDSALIKAYWFAAKFHGLQNIIELLDYRDTEIIGQYADCFQVGCRQMQNYSLLREVGQSGKPVFLKRHPGSTIDELLGAAEHVLKAGCKELYLIERGSSSHATHVRWDLSISIIPAIQAITKIPVIVDGSHGTGRRDLVAPMTLAGVAAGANGILVETHLDPEKSLSDADQAISKEEYISLIEKVKKVKGVLT